MADDFKILGKGVKFYYMLHPSPTIVLVTKCPNGRFNLMPASWNVPISEEPPTVGVAVDKEAYTHECLEYHGEATINVPHSGLVDVVYALGSTSGRDVDKVSKFNIKLEPSETVGVPRWGDAIGVYEAIVWKKVDVGEVTFYVFQVKAAYAKEGLYTRWGWDFRKINILLHGAGRAFYQVGRMVRAKPAIS